MISEHEKDLERIKKLRLIDNDFMKICFADNKEAVQLVVRTILNREDIFITDVQVERQYQNLRGHSIAIDVFGEDAQHRQIGVEIQRANRGAIPQRAGYHSSTLDMNSLPANTDYAYKYENYSIWITEHDVLKANKPLYHIDRCVAETGEKFGDGSHIILNYS